MSDQSEKPAEATPPQSPSLQETAASFAAAIKWANENPEEAAALEAEDRARWLAKIRESQALGDRPPPSDHALFDEAARRVEAGLGRALTAEQRGRVAGGPVEALADARERDRFEQRMIEDCATPEAARRFLKDFF